MDVASSKCGSFIGYDPSPYTLFQDGFPVILSTASQKKKKNCYLTPEKHVPQQQQQQQQQQQRQSLPLEIHLQRCQCLPASAKRMVVPSWSQSSSARGRASSSQSLESSPKSMSWRGRYDLGKTCCGYGGWKMLEKHLRMSLVKKYSVLGGSSHLVSGL